MTGYQSEIAQNPLLRFSPLWEQLTKLRETFPYIHWPGEEVLHRTRCEGGVQSIQALPGMLPSQHPLSSQPGSSLNPFVRLFFGGLIREAWSITLLFPSGHWPYPEGLSKWQLINMSCSGVKRALLWVTEDAPFIVSVCSCLRSWGQKADIITEVFPSLSSPRRLKEF